MHGIRPTHIHPGRRLEVSWPLRPTPNQRHPTRESRFATGLTREEHRLHQAERSRVDVDNHNRRFVGDAVNNTPHHTVERSLGIKHIRRDPRPAQPNAWHGGIAQAALHSSQWQDREMDRQNMTDVISLRKRKATHMINPLREPDAELDVAERRPFKRTIHLDTWNKTAVRDIPANNEYTSAPALQTFAETAPLRSHDPSLSARFDEARQRTTIHSTQRSNDHTVRSSAGYTFRHQMPNGTTGPPAVETFTNHDRGNSTRPLQRLDAHRGAVLSTTHNPQKTHPSVNQNHSTSFGHRMAIVPADHTTTPMPFRTSSVHPHIDAIPLSGATPYQSVPRPVHFTNTTTAFAERKPTDHVGFRSTDVLGTDVLGTNALRNTTTAFAERKPTDHVGFLSTDVLSTEVLGTNALRTTTNPFAPVSLYRAATTTDQPKPLGFMNRGGKSGTREYDPKSFALAYHTNATTLIPIRPEGYHTAVQARLAHSGQPVTHATGHRVSTSNQHHNVIPTVAASAANHGFDFRTAPMTVAPVSTIRQMRNASDSVPVMIDTQNQRPSQRSQSQRIQNSLSVSHPDGATMEQRNLPPPTSTSTTHPTTSGYAVTVDLKQPREHDRSVSRTVPSGVSFSDGTKPGLGVTDRLGPLVSMPLTHPSIATSGTPLSHANLLVRAMGDDANVAPFERRVRENWFRSSSAGDWLEGMGTKWKQPTGGLRPHW